MFTEFYRTLLTGSESEIYALILTGLQNRAEVIRIPLTPSAGVNRIYRAVLADHPELAWASGKWRGSRGTTDAVYPSYTLTDLEIGLFGEQVSELLNYGSKLLALPEPKRVLFVYNLLTKKCAYDPEAPHSQSAYGALIDQRAVCRGLSKGFQLIMSAASIPATCVEGTLDGQALHVWNIISVENQNVHVDVSMGYPQFEYLYKSKGLRYNKYSAFCVSDEILRRTHSWDPDSLPLRCSSADEEANNES